MAISYKSYDYDNPFAKLKDPSKSVEPKKEPIKTKLELEFEKKIKKDKIFDNPTMKFYLITVQDKPKIRKTRRSGGITAQVTLDDFNYIWAETKSLYDNIKPETPLIKAIKHNYGFIAVVKEDLKLKILKKDDKKYNYHSKMITDINSVLTNFAKVKIINYEESGKLFKFVNYKKQMYELANPSEEEIKDGKTPLLYDITNIEPGHECKADGVVRNIITLYNRDLDKSLKFVLDDVEIIYPDIDNFIKGYSKPKDRSIKVGDSVSLKNNRGINRTISLTDKYIYKANKNTGYKKYATITNLKNNKTFNVPYNKLKKIC